MARIYRKKLEETIFKLLDVAKELGVAVTFKDHRCSEEIWADCSGYFDCQKNLVIVYKRVDKPLNMYHIFTLAHELRHAWQFRNRFQPMMWLCNIGVYPSYKNAQQAQALEADADQWAKEFMIKNKLPVPAEISEFKEENI